MLRLVDIQCECFRCWLGREGVGGENERVRWNNAITKRRPMGRHAAETTAMDEGSLQRQEGLLRDDEVGLPRECHSRLGCETENFWLIIHCRIQDCVCVYTSRFADVSSDARSRLMS
jgi:hypothetical protein